MSDIIIKGAKENNLKNIDLTIPRNMVVAFVGVSGSGKSTIAFDIVAKEGQRQYFESLSSYARRYLQKSNRPQVDEIKGISSTVVINQDRVHSSPRSTVGTVTETYTYLRLLFARAGWPVYDSSYFSFNHPLGACPRCKGLGRAMDVDINKLVDMDKSLNEGAIKYSNWRVNSMAWKIIKSTNYFDMDRKLKDYSKEDLDKLLYGKKEVVKAYEESVINWTYKGVVTHLTSRGSSNYRTVSTDEMKYFSYVECPECHGWRLKKESLAVKINGLNIGEAGNLPIYKAIEWVKGIDHKNAQVIKPRIIEQFQFLIDAGVGYLSLNRGTDTLSGGEAQRIKLARQLGCDLIETIYVMDEPTAGLHPRDVEVVINNLKRLRDGGNTVLVVEHDAAVIKGADYIVEVGPGGGKLGGEIVFNGTSEELKNNSNSLTSQYVYGQRDGLSKDIYRKPIGYIEVKNATRNNLKNVSVSIPTGTLTCLTGVSGAGKSSLVEEIVECNQDKVLLIGQQPIGNNKRGCIATYVGIFDEIRKIFAKESGLGVPMFSFNSKGACEECDGLGFIDMDMNFLGDVRTRCDKCRGKRYNDEVLKYKLKGKNIAEVLEMTALEGLDLFKCKSIRDGLQMLVDVGLDYIEIGQTLDTLSGGESQRLKIASRLRNKGEFYILDEPTSGLHFADIEKLMKLLNRLVDNGNTVLVIEHNLELIKNADWIIDMGPEGGDGGGEVIAQGTPKDIAACDKSYTGKFLKEVMDDAS